MARQTEHQFPNFGNAHVSCDARQAFSKARVDRKTYLRRAVKNMTLDKYALKAGQDQTVFEFISEGTKGAIRIIILFQPTTESNLYNLAFGDRDPLTGSVNDMAVSNNGDTDKVLATVVGALYAFCERYPEAFVYATGSTAARTRLYRMGITRFQNEIQNDFFLYGQVGDDFPEFELGKEYDGFLAKRKFD